MKQALNLDPNVVLVNNSRADIRGIVEEAAIVAVRGDGELPDELADLFVLSVHVRPDGSRYGVLDFA